MSSQGGRRAILVHVTNILAMTEPKEVDENHPVIRGLRWILANKRGPRGKLWSMSGLSKEAGRAGSQVEQILSGRQSAEIARDLARDLARAADVRTAWLLTGDGPVEPFVEDGDSPQATRIDTSTGDEMPGDWIADMEWAVGAAELDGVQADDFRRKRRSIGFPMGRQALFALALESKPEKTPDRTVADEPKAPVEWDLAGEAMKRR